MIESSLNKAIGRELEALGRKRNEKILLSSLIIILAVLSIFLLKPQITGFIVAEKQLNYSDAVNLEFNESSEYIWIPEHYGLLKSLKLSGSYKPEGNARVYLEDGSFRHLIFDSSRSNPSPLESITGMVISNESSIFNGNEISNEADGNGEDNNAESGENSNNNENGVDELVEIIESNQTANETIEINETEAVINETGEEEINRAISAELDYKKDSD